MARGSQLRSSGGNLFQRIKAMCTAAEASGTKLWRLSIGQPKGAALLEAREAASRAILSDEESMHEYQDNGSPGVPDFARRFVLAHFQGAVDPRFNNSDEVAYLPTPGTKTMLAIIPLACGGTDESTAMKTMTDPGYPTPAVWADFFHLDHSTLPTNPENQFRFRPEDIETWNELVMVNYPHNPSGQIANSDHWRQLCQYCSDNNIRLFNDAAYVALWKDPASCTLAEVAIDYPNLSWAEAYSASKLIQNATGWRVGAIVGSPDFIRDIATIKGDLDSGFTAPQAAGVLHALENDKVGIEKVRRTYSNRIDHLCSLLKLAGMRLAVEPGAGFFTLWLVPKRAFGEEIRDAEHFNSLMIENTGVVGVHFGEYIRYAVTSPIEDEEWTGVIAGAFIKAEVSYE
jgi:LL-diaminopimelate aminotransferase